MNLEIWKVKIMELPLWVHAAFIMFMLVGCAGISYELYKNEKDPLGLVFHEAPGLAIATVLEKVYDSETERFIIQFGSEDQGLIDSQTWMRDQIYVKLHANANEEVYSSLSIDEKVVLAYKRRGQTPRKVWIVKKK